MFFIKFSQAFLGFSDVVFITSGTKESDLYKKTVVTMQLLPSKIVYYDENISENMLMNANQTDERTAFLLHLL
ncbi:Uncharacterised protein [Streptococcus australis]|uniref:Uncharacterized protein n=1 Tax=Streptococcus viridans TaxID=78535 RepID=A0A3S5DZA3_9STRE|nr:Uncharacterised protein [Streptococcus viridans]VEE19035.1 Uncharacterised protein [Streptococcus australis]